LREDLVNQASIVEV
jgi:hypothetical protein